MTVVGISLVPLHKYRHFQTIMSNELWYVVLGHSYLLPGMIARSYGLHYQRMENSVLLLYPSYKHVPTGQVLLKGPKDLGSIDLDQGY